MADDEVMRNGVDGSPNNEVQNADPKGTLDASDLGKGSPMDPESDGDVPVEAEELQDALTRAPPVNSSYLPLPWKGRLGYVSLQHHCPKRILMLHRHV